MHGISQNLCFLTVTALTFAVPAFEGSASSPNNASGGVLAKHVSSFNVENLSIIDGVLQLGQQEKVPLGIEYVTLEALQRPVSIRLHRTTFGDAIKAILGKGSGFTFHVDRAVVVVTGKTASPRQTNLLNKVLPEVFIPRSTFGEASHQVDMILRGQLHPEEGTVGDYNPQGDLVGPLKMRNVTVRDALNRLISGQNIAAWIVLVRDGRLSEIPTQGLWTILEYQTPPKRYAEYLRRRIFD